MGVQYLELRAMIDSALGHPEKGIVNLNILHSLLHEILNHLDPKTAKENITNVAKDVRKDKADYFSETKLDNRLLSEPDDQASQDNCGVLPSCKNIQRQGNEKIKLNEFEERLASIETKLDALNNIPINKSFLAQTTLSHDKETAQNDTENTLAMMWKFMTIHRRVQATEEAVENVMNILNDMIEDVRYLKKVESRQNETNGSKMSEEFRAGKKGSGSEINFEKLGSLDEVAFKKDLAPFVTWTALEQALNKRQIETKTTVTSDSTEHQKATERPDTAPLPSNPHDVMVGEEPPKTAMGPKEFTKLTGQNPDELATFSAENDIKDAFTSKENSFNEISLDRSLNDNVLSREDTSDSINEPSPEFLNQLNRIGELPKQYDDVAVQVSTMSELQTKLASEVQKVEVDILPRKVDKEDLQLPENLVEQMDMLKQGLNMLNTNKDLQMLATIKDTSVQNKENIDSLKAEIAMFSQHLKRLDQLKDMKEPDTNVAGYEQEVLNSVRDKLNVVEQEQEKMVLKSKEDIDKILKNLDEKQKVIDDLFQYAEQLQERKADRENVATEMNVKADKHALDGKVNQSTFDETFQMFDRGLQDALQKMEDYMNEEISLKDTLSRISREMEGKIDNDSLQLMKDYFEKQIKDVQESRDKIARETRVDAADAAGVRRKLPVHYHCISCNRPVELSVRDSEPALPESESLPYRKTKIPFTSYEVEQLRQKSMKSGYNAEESATIRDLVSSRPCGGSHTVINSQLRKSTKFHQFNQTMAIRDARFVPKLVREVSVLDFLRGSDGHYYKGRSRHLLPAIPHRTTYPSNADASTDSDSYKSNGPDQQKAGSHYLLRTPSPPPQDNLSSSYPERPKTQSIQGQRYSSDDINIPSNTALNRESLKIFRRKRGQDKEPKRHRCWDNQSPNSKGESQRREGDLNGSSSPKSMKRTTPVGEEQPSPEESPQKHGVRNDTTKEKSRILNGGDKE